MRVTANSEHLDVKVVENIEFHGFIQKTQKSRSSFSIAQKKELIGEPILTLLGPYWCLRGTTPTKLFVISR